MSRESVTITAFFRNSALGDWVSEKAWFTRARLIVKPHEWLREVDLQSQFFANIGATQPPELEVQREALRAAIELAQQETARRAPGKYID